VLTNNNYSAAFATRNNHITRLDLLVQYRGFAVKKNSSGNFLKAGNDGNL